jgi:uncharacterized membrane protein YfcA
MYAQLYDATLAWYARMKVTPSYLHAYVATGLALMACLNIGSCVILCAQWGSRWARWALDAGGTWWLGFAVVILAAHLLYSRRRQVLLDRASSASPPKRSPWIAGSYMVLSVIAFMYVSTLAPIR